MGIDTQHFASAQRSGMHATGFGDLVDDVLAEVARFLPRASDVLNFGLVERRILPCIIPALYVEVLLSRDVCAQALEMLSKRPEWTCCVHSLTVEPDEMEGRPERDLSSTTLAGMVVQMTSLHTFLWKGWTTPLDDQLWLNLRTSCPKLRRIGVSIGSMLPPADSQLYSFQNLTSFSVFLRDQYFESHGGPDEPPALNGMWEMLLEQCPHLEELVFDGVSSSRPTAAYRLVEGNWPMLRKLCLGDVLSEPPTPAVLNPQSKRRLITFLDTHNTLEHLQLSAHVNLHPVSFNGIQKKSLPILSHFSGSIFHAGTLRSYRTLKSLRLDEPLHLRQNILSAVTAVLEHFSLLESLWVSFLVEKQEQSGPFIEKVFEATTNLKSLRLFLGVAPSVTVAELSGLITVLPKLQALDVGLVPASPQESLYDGAATLIAKHRGLQCITLTFLPATVPLVRGKDPRRDMSAVFEVIPDAKGNPVAFKVTEERWRDVGSPSRKRRRIQVLDGERSFLDLEHSPWATWIVVLPWLTVLAAVMIGLQH